MKQLRINYIFRDLTTIFLLFFLTTLTPVLVSAQCQPYISIDGNNTSASTTALPIWMHEGQTLGMNEAVPSISVIEFTVSGSSLEFSQVLSITSTSTVPAGKVWKIESMVITPLIGNVLNNITYTSSGTFKVPSCTNFICIEVWGAGGGGGNCDGCASNQGGGGGGGGGGYGSGCYTVTPGSTINVTVGTGGSATSTGGTTSVGSLISATGGAGGGSGTSGIGGAGGSSSAYVQITGGKGTNGSASGQGGKAGGNGANGGAGGSGGGSSGPTAGTAPGGGGASGANVNNTTYTGRNGARGEVKISW